jgi:hypothetical protein
MKRVATHREPPVVVPVIIVLVDVHLALAIPAIEDRVANLYEEASVPPPIETFALSTEPYSASQCPTTSHQVTSFLKCLHVPRYPKS